MERKKKLRTMEHHVGGPPVEHVPHFGNTHVEAGEQQSGQETVTKVAGEDSRDFRAVEGVELTDLLFVVR